MKLAVATFAVGVALGILIATEILKHAYQPLMDFYTAVHG